MTLKIVSAFVLILTVTTAAYAKPTKPGIPVSEVPVRLTFEHILTLVSALDIKAKLSYDSNAQIPLTSLTGEITTYFTENILSRMSDSAESNILFIDTKDILLTGQVTQLKENGKVSDLLEAVVTFERFDSSGSKQKAYLEARLDTPKIKDLIRMRVYEIKIVSTGTLSEAKEIVADIDYVAKQQQVEIKAGGKTSFSYQDVQAKMRVTYDRETGNVRTQAELDSLSEKP